MKKPGWKKSWARVSPDLFNDGTLVCWFFAPDLANFDLVRFDPQTGTRTSLLENTWLIDLSQ